MFERPSRSFEALNEDLMRPILHVPRHPIRLVRFGVAAAMPVVLLARVWKTPQARALFGGVAAHSFSPFTWP